MTLELATYSAILFQCYVRCCSSVYFFLTCSLFEGILIFGNHYANHVLNYICSNNEKTLKSIHNTFNSRTPCCVILIFFATFWTEKHKAPQHCSALITTDWYWRFFRSVLGWIWVSPLVFVEEELVSNTSQLFLPTNQLITEAWQGRIFDCQASHFAVFILNATNQFHAIQFRCDATLHPSILLRLKRAGIEMKSKEQRGPKLRNPCMCLIWTGVGFFSASAYMGMFVR